MIGKRILQLFPFLRPLRQAQRKFCFYARMRFDGRRYARTLDVKALPYAIFTFASPMINTRSGFPIEYQYNKVHNLMVAARQLDGLLIRPGETFSFYQCVRHADKYTPYKDGLNLVDGKIVGAYGGGLCQLSNLLYWLFLHTPLTIVERHGHAVESFPPAEADLPHGTDATVCEGWKDLKARNDTKHSYQLSIRFDADTMYGCIFSDAAPEREFVVYNARVDYVAQGAALYQRAQVLRDTIDLRSGDTRTTPLYTNCCQITYALPEDIRIQEEEIA